MYDYEHNKAGYTANTSRERVGNGGNARFHTFPLDHHGPTNGPTNRPTDHPTNGRTDKAGCRVAYKRLKNAFLCPFAIHAPSYLSYLVMEPCAKVLFGKSSAIVSWHFFKELESSQEQKEIGSKRRYRAHLSIR